MGKSKKFEWQQGEFLIYWIDLTSDADKQSNDKKF